MNKYVYCECPVDEWPELKTISAKSYNDAVEKLILKYGTEFDDDKILSEIEDFLEFRDYLNEKYTIALSDLEDIEEL